MPAPDQKSRAIRSFVRRSGRITPSQKMALENYWSNYGIDYRESSIELPTGFDAVKMEIGIGNGDALISMAAADPRSLYLGVEVHDPGIGRCLNNIHRLELANVRLIKHDAIEVLAQMILPASLDRVLLFFPDPWHKKRHHKRRLVQPEFIQRIRSKLKVGGICHLATDWENYAEHMMEVMIAAEGFRNTQPGTEFAPRPEHRPITKFEQRGERLGHGVWDLLFERVD